MPSMTAIRLVGFAGALCLGLMLGLVFGGGVHLATVVLIAGGAALTLGVCAWAELR